MDRYRPHEDTAMHWIRRNTKTVQPAANKIKTDSYIYIEIRKGMYELKQAAQLPTSSCRFNGTTAITDP
jgi:hypothetical protein